MAEKYDYVLMDLDGTITDPMLGITRCVQYALKHFGVEVEDLRELCPFIGPPLLDSFQEFYGFSAEQAEEAILKYRERFATIGIYENKVYPEMPALLARLHQSGKKIVVATSKPEVFARKILEYFELAGYFYFIGGATLDGLRSRKEEVLEYVLETCGIKELSEVVMVGDRKFDIWGAHQVGVKAVGVTYGYGSLEELKEAGADYVVNSVKELGDLLK